MMSLKKRLVVALCGAALTPVPALCQETAAYKTEVSVEGFLPIVKSTARDSQLFVRAEYRGIFYNSPTFNLTVLNGLDRYTHRAEPAIGFAYKF